jgi:hypothetical protein
MEWNASQQAYIPSAGKQTVKFMESDYLLHIFRRSGIGSDP